MKNVKNTTMCMALLGLAVLLGACNGNDKKTPYDMNEARNRVARAVSKNKNKYKLKIEELKRKIKHEAIDSIWRKNRLEAIDSVIVGNFTGKGIDTLYIAKHCCAKPFYTSYEFWDASYDEEDLDASYKEEWTCLEKGRVKETKLEKCTVLSRSGNLPKLEFKNVYGRGIVFEGDLDSNGTDEFGYFMLKHRYPIKLKGDIVCEKQGILSAEKYELLNYVYHIITFLDGKWQCVAKIDNEYERCDGLIVRPSNGSNIKAIHTSYDRFNCGNINEEVMYMDTSIVPIKYRPIK